MRKTVLLTTLMLVGFVMSTAAQQLTPGDDFDSGNGSLTSAVLPSRLLGVTSAPAVTVCIEHPPVYCAPLAAANQGEWFVYTHVIPVQPQRRSLWSRVKMFLTR